MKTEAKLFLTIAGFAWIMAIIYGIWTDQSQGRVEDVGVAGLILSGGLLGLSGSFFWFVSRRIDARPEDRGDAEIAEGAGELGFFSPGSYWPFGVALMATVIGAGLAFVQVWLVIVGVIALLIAVGGLLFEYYIGGRRPLG
jgi:Cytochrome c oxidase subunit IV